MGPQFERLIPLLARADIEFILVGGLAGIVHGAARATYDVDVVYNRSPDNLERLAEALRPQAPYLRGAPPGLPFHWDATTLRNGMNFTLTTSLGDLDLLGEIIGGGDYTRLLPETFETEAFGVKFRCLGLEGLIRVKIAAGRPKDFEAIAELQAILKERKGTG